MKATLPEQLRAHTDQTIAERSRLIEQLAAVVGAGYAVDRGEYMEDVCSIAVPIRDYTRSVVGSLAVAGAPPPLPPPRGTPDIAPLNPGARRGRGRRPGGKEKSGGRQHTPRAAPRTAG